MRVGYTSPKRIARGGSLGDGGLCRVREICMKMKNEINSFKMMINDSMKWQLESEKLQ